MRGFVCLAALLVMFSLSTNARTDEISEKGRDVLESHREAVVTLKIVMNQKITFPGMPSRNNESKVEATGTVISPDGLTVMSLSETDPSSVVESMMAGNPQGANLQMETEIRDVQIMLDDGSEIPAEIILRDKDLDMAFVRPLEKPETSLRYVALDTAGTPQQLDQIITLNRLGRVANRAYSASVERIEAIVDRPRTFYLPGNDPTLTGLGSPAFTLDGAFIGVFLLRVVNSPGGGGLGGMLGGGNNNMTSIILPVADIAEAAEQAPPFKE